MGYWATRFFAPGFWAPGFWAGSETPTDISTGGGSGVPAKKKRQKYGFYDGLLEAQKKASKRPIQIPENAVYAKASASEYQQSAKEVSNARIKAERDVFIKNQNDLAIVLLLGTP